MSHKPPLPDDYDLPHEVNGWVHDPESNRNGHVWSAEAHESSVAMFAHVGTVRVAVFDDRVDGFANKVEPFRDELPDDRTDLPAAVAEGIDEAVTWMNEHAPAEWSHPDVNEAVFDPPAGYELDWYFLEQRDTTIYYRREGAESVSSLFNDGRPEEVTPETFPYLVIHMWNGSGNAEVSIAPWTRAHDHQMETVVEPPEECGMEVALKFAREYVEGDDAEVTTGQTGLAQFAKAGREA